MMFAILLFSVFKIKTTSSPKYTSESLKIVTDDVPEQYIGKVNLDSVAIRVLVLKHCPDSIANVDSDQCIAAVNLAASRGLTIKDIGNYHIDPDGRTNESMLCRDLSGLKDFINEQAKVDAQPGDTLMIYTIGHGGGDGTLMRLGQRKGLMKILAEVAEENDQEIFWWQLSCHAAARLPSISTLSERQQELFSMTASSPANEYSYFTTQGALMEEVFLAMANHSREIDPNQDQIITAGELETFMIRHFGRVRGELLYAKSPNEPIFGLLGGLANRIPIIDRNGNQTEYPRNYIPMPRRD